MSKLFLLFTGAAALSLAGFWLLVQLTSAKALSGEDPLSVQPPNSPNWALAAPNGLLPNARIETPVTAEPPRVLIDALTAKALARPRVTRTDDGSDPLYRSFVQRSALMRFPDVISVRAIERQGGAALVAYSRSIYGHSDLGVNAARLRTWLDLE